MGPKIAVLGTLCPFFYFSAQITPFLKDCAYTAATRPGMLCGPNGQLWQSNYQVYQNYQGYLNYQGYQGYQGHQDQGYQLQGNQPSSKESQGYGSDAAPPHGNTAALPS